MARKTWKPPKGIGLVAFSTRRLREDLRDRLRLVSMQQEKITGSYYPIERVLNDVVLEGLEVLEPVVAKKFKIAKREREAS